MNHDSCTRFENDRSDWHADPPKRREWIGETLAHLTLVTSSGADDGEESPLAREFHEHADKWVRETANSSSIRESVLHPSYQRIIGMGRAVLPLIFERLEEQPDPWFWALRAITGEDPIAQADAGRVRKMAEVWLAWARERHLS